MNKKILKFFILLISLTGFSLAEINTKYAPIINDDTIILVPIIEQFKTSIIGDNALCLIGTKLFIADDTGSVNPQPHDTTHLWEVTSKPSGSNMQGVQSQSEYFYAEPDVFGAYTLSLTSTYRASNFGIPFGPILTSTDSMTFTLNDCFGQPVSIDINILLIDPDRTFYNNDYIAFLLLPTVRNAEENDVTYLWTIISKPSGSSSNFGVEKRQKNPTLYVDLIGSYTVKVVATVEGISSTSTRTVKVVSQ